MLTRADIDARMGHKAGDGTEWMEETLPGLYFRLASNTNRNMTNQHWKPPVWDI
jgi:hypothetical protein